VAQFLLVSTFRADQRNLTLMSAQLRLHGRFGVSLSKKMLFFPTVARSSFGGGFELMGDPEQRGFWSLLERGLL
jgi:hypothetical protein